MSSNQDYNTVSYEKHDANYCDYACGGQKADLARTWFNKHTVDAWLHQRMYSGIDPVLTLFPESRWLTVGDGRYGTDAHYILSKGGEATATDISDVLLKEGASAGFIKTFQKENAESLSFPDRSFDFVLCKESYHHFPRPMIALYEMLRVAKRGVILIEPQDNFILNTFRHFMFRNIKDSIKRITGRKVIKDSFEEVGNYCYTISKREIEKVALGLNYKTVAFKDSHMYYLKGVEYENLEENGKFYRQVKFRIGLYDLLSRMGFQQGGLLTAIIFKEPVSVALRNSLAESGFSILDLPENPYSHTKRNRL